MIHVTWDKPKKRWHVLDSSERTESGEAIEIGVYYKKTIAISQGRSAAKERRTELKIHIKSGPITQSISYGNDPRNIKG